MQLFLPLFAKEKMRSGRSIKKQKCKTKAFNSTRYLRSHSASYKHSASLPRFSQGSSSSDNYFLSAHEVQVQNNIHFPLPVLNQGTMLLCIVKLPSRSTADTVKPLLWLNNPDLWQGGLREGEGFKKESARLQRQCIWFFAAASFITFNSKSSICLHPTPLLCRGA